jgi:signal transduction histidine kinase
MENHETPARETPVAGVSASQEDALFSQRLVWVTGARLLLLLVLLTGTAFFYFRGALSSFPTSRGLLLATIGAGFVLGAAYAGALRIGRFTRTLAVAQLLLDQCAWTVVVYVSGGPTSGASTLYALTCVIAAVLVGRRGAVLAAVAALVLYGGLCLAAVRGLLHAPTEQHIEWATTPHDVGWAFLLNGLGIVVVAVLSGYLAHRVRATGGELVEARERAEAAERLAVLGRIAAGLAHEIRNPLGAISGSVEILREAPGLTAEDRALCDIVTVEVARLEDLVSDMMDLARPRPAAPESVDVVAVASDIAKLATASNRGAEVDIRFEGPVSAMGYFDLAQLRQIIWNLLRNAVQATPSGGVIHLRILNDSNLDRPLELLVDDEGAGVPPERRARLFDPFFTTRTHGAGLGLAVVRRIVDEHSKHGARISVEDAEPRGARFRLTIPRNRRSFVTLPPFRSAAESVPGKLGAEARKG